MEVRSSIDRPCPEISNLPYNGSIIHFQHFHLLTHHQRSTYCASLSTKPSPESPSPPSWPSPVPLAACSAPKSARPPARRPHTSAPPNTKSGPRYRAKTTSAAPADRSHDQANQLVPTLSRETGTASLLPPPAQKPLHEIPWRAYLKPALMPKMAKMRYLRARVQIYRTSQRPLRIRPLHHYNPTPQRNNTLVSLG